MDSIELLWRILFWGSLSLVFFAYAGYPVVIWGLSRCRGQRPVESTDTPAELPTLSVLIAAHNEEAVIAARVANALALDYPAEKLEVVVASDGSTDATGPIVRGFADRGVRLLDYRKRRGKAAVVNSAVAELKGDVVLLTDANTMTDSQAARRLVRWFRDPDVGVVCGRLELTDARTGKNVDGLYWKYETFLKRCEGRLGALLGANGAIYALRRERFTPIPNDTIVDDLVIPLQARLHTGCAVLYDNDAVAHEETAPDLAAEFRRRSRIGAGGFQSIGLLWRLLDPRHGWIAFTFFGHKLLRWACPFFLVSILLSNLMLCEHRFFRGVIHAQFGFYWLAMAASFVPGRSRLLKPLRLATMFTSMNAALLVGFSRWLLGTQQAAWQRTARLAEADGGIG
jgi:cellulose synthase/poly-beta-1,6-N-acetylglucosamine synthase-like glycosyltransferase